MTRTQLYLQSRTAQCVLTRKSVLWHAPGSAFRVHPPSRSELRLTGRENATTLKKIPDDDQGSRILSFMFSRSVLLDNPELVCT